METSLVKSNSSSNFSQIVLTLSDKSFERDDKIDNFSEFTMNFVRYFVNFCSNSEERIDTKSIFVSNELFSKILSKIFPFSLITSFSLSSCVTVWIFSISLIILFFILSLIDYYLVLN